MLPTTHAEAAEYKANLFIAAAMLMKYAKALGDHCPNYAMIFKEMLNNICDKWDRKKEESMVKLFKDGDEMAVMTDAVDEKMFIDQISKTIEELIESEAFDSDWEFQFSYWLPAIVDICCKYRGYKNGVIEQRILCSSSHGVLPQIPLIASYDKGETKSFVVPLDKE